MTKSIKQTLEKIIRENDFLEDGLYNGYVNLTALAVYLLPTIQKILKKETTIGSLTMTLSRIAQNIQKTTIHIRIRPEDIRIRTDITYITFSKVSGLIMKLKEIPIIFEGHSLVDHQFFSQLEGSREVTVLHTAEYSHAISEVCLDFPPNIIKQNLVTLIIHIPAKYLEEKGFLYYVVKQLNFYNVNIIELYTTQTELSVLISHDDLIRAMSILL